MSPGIPIGKILTITLISVTTVLIIIGIFSTEWTKVSALDIVWETEGLFSKCLSKDCHRIGNPSEWRSIVQYVSYLMLAILFTTSICECVAIYFRMLRVTKIFSICYAVAALLGFLIIILFPTAVKPLGKDGIKETWLGWGFYTFLLGNCLLVAVAVHCFEYELESYPSLE
ncbi:unnamed protein product [Lymnaea stagnalis]|uniref:Uncharacterized protein n=1 Tax=Lymnaea stagnalis TaxID=6523 RepID=A0AAV2HEF7_LYMST